MTGRVGAIWAQARDGVIGADGTVPWHVPEDLAHFQRTTKGHGVVMGRATWDSLPPRWRPLPHRRCVVLTRDPDWSAPGAVAATDLDEAVALAAAPGEGADGDVWIIGGAQVYALALRHEGLVDRLAVTDIDLAVPGTAIAPVVDPGIWRAAGREADEGWTESAGGARFRITWFDRT